MAGKRRSNRLNNNFVEDRPRRPPPRRRNNPIPPVANLVEVDQERRRHGGDLVEDLWYSNLVPHELEEISAPKVISPMPAAREAETSARTQQPRDKPTTDDDDDGKPVAKKLKFTSTSSMDTAAAAAATGSSNSNSSADNHNHPPHTTTTTTNTFSTIRMHDPQLGEIPHLLLVDLQDPDIIVVGDTLQELSRLMGTNVEHQDQVVALGGHALILVAMRNHFHHDPIQEHGAFCLSFLVWNRPAVCQAVDQFGGLEWILHVSEFYGTHHEPVQFAACCAIGGLLPQSAACRERLVREYDGVAWILNLMKAFADHARMQVIGCQILTHLLACGAVAKEKMKAPGFHAVSIVAKATEQHAHDTDLERDAKTFMLQFYGAPEKEGEGRDSKMPAAT